MEREGWRGQIISQNADRGGFGIERSAEEARARACVFYPIGWICRRSECDKELINDFENRTEWS